MFGFLIKKAFFDLWDNLFRIVALNLGFLAVLALLVYFPLLLQSMPVLFYVSVVAGVLVLFLYTGAAGEMVRDIADYRQPELRRFGEYLKASWKPSLLFGLSNVVLLFLLSVALPVYGGMRSFFGPLAAALLFWVFLAWLVAAQFFFPLLSRLDRSYRKIIRKMFLLFFDNTFFAIGLLIGGTLILAVSVFTALLLPGPAAVLLWLNDGLKLRLYKYDHLEKHPAARRKGIPWDALLAEDRERVGKRSLKGMIFPWKE